jgi:hypothetical protein
LLVAESPVTDVNSDVTGVIAMGVVAFEESQVAAQRQVLSLLRTIAAVTTERELTDKAGRRPPPISLYFRASPNSCLGDENARLPEVFCTYILRAKFLIAMISAKSGPMPADPGRGGAGRRPPGLETAPVRFECIEQVPGSFDRMF